MLLVLMLVLKSIDWVGQDCRQGLGVPNKKYRLATPDLRICAERSASHS